MKHWAVNLIGMAAGLVVGIILVPERILAGLAQTHVTWDASQCPAGEYTITSTASNVQTGQSFQTTSSSVRLPAAAFGQDFADLPSGTYRVIAHAGNADGGSFDSSAQTLTVGAGTSVPPEIADGMGPGHHRPAASPTIGVAQPRAPSAQSTQGGASAPRSVEAIVPDSSESRGALPAVSRLKTEISLLRALDIVAQLTAGAPDSRHTVSDIAAVDEDGDGLIDYVRVTIAGKVRVWRVR